MKKKEKRNRRHGWVHTTAAMTVAFFVTVTALPVVAGVGHPEEAKGGQPPTFVELTGILERLDAELERLQGIELAAVEEQLEAILGLLEELSEELAVEPESEEDSPQIRERLVKLDLILHRLVAMLERIVERAEAGPSHGRERAKEMLDDLHRWTDGYIAGATRRMGRIEAQQFEKTTKAILGEVAKQLNRIGQRARGQQAVRGRLENLVERIEALLARLDRFLIRSFLRPPMERPLSLEP